MRPPRSVISIAASRAGTAPEQSTTIPAPPPVSPRTALAKSFFSGSGAWVSNPCAAAGGELADQRVEPERAADQRRRRPDRAVADHHKSFARPRVPAIERVQPDRQRLQHRADFVADVVGQRHRAVGGEADQRGEGAVGGQPDRAAVDALVVAALDAGLALAAAPAGVGRHPVAGLHLVDALSDRGDHAGELVPQRHRRCLPGQRVGLLRPDREVVSKLGQVGAADAAIGDFHLDHSGPERQRQLDVLEP
jgi:hypothetical protein